MVKGVSSRGNSAMVLYDGVVSTDWHGIGTNLQTVGYKGEGLTMLTI